MRSENNSLQSEIDLADSISETYRIERDVLRDANIRKDSVNQIIAKNIRDIHRVATDALKPKKWWQREWVIFAGGVLLGGLILK